MSALHKAAPVGVVGAGTMGAGVAQVAAAAGHPVLLFDSADGLAEQGIARIAAGLDRQVARGRMTPEARAALLARVSPTATLAALAPARLVVEAIVENLDSKRRLLGALENVCAADCILASNTSSLSITALAQPLRRPENCVGMHFFNPAPSMQLVEVVSGLSSSPAVAQRVFDTAVAWGKQAVHARSTPGFIVNRVARPFYAEALRVREENGGEVATLDAVMRECGGFRMGPFELMDLIGHDVNYAVTEAVFNAYSGEPRFRPSPVQRELVDGGFLGRKSGRGFYDYGAGADHPRAPDAAPGTAPDALTVYGDGAFADAVAALAQGNGIALTRHAAQPDDVLLRVADARVALSDGRPATVRSAQDRLDNLLLVDQALAPLTCTRVAVSMADQCAPAARQAAIGLFQALGKRVSVLDDVAGMMVTRTVCALANAGADAVQQGVCSAAAVDTAMCAGLNYPLGPLAWAERIGLPRVMRILEHLNHHYADGRYRISPLLRRCVMRASGFHG